MNLWEIFLQKIPRGFPGFYNMYMQKYYYDSNQASVMVVGSMRSTSEPAPPNLLK